MSKSLPTATVSDLWRWGPCGGREAWQHITDRYEDEPWTALEVLDYRVLPRRWISDADRLWVVLQPALVPESVLHEFACVVAERALRRERAAGREPDPRSWAAIELKRRWLRGDASAAELVAAEAAATAAWAAAGAAARAAEAAATAAWAAARAAWAAAGAAGAAARAAAGAAGWAAERAQQVRDLRRLLREWVRS